MTLHVSPRHGCRGHGLLAALLLSGATGCTQTGAPEMRSCLTTACLDEIVQQQLVSNCITALHWNPSSRAARQAVHAEYRYPLTNADSYRAFVRMGGRGSAPHEWCRVYARAKQQQVASLAD